MKPGVNIESTVNMTNSDTTSLTKEDICIIWGGTQYVAKIETEVVLRLLKKFVGRHQHNNLIMMSIPNRYDLAMESCVNSEIKVFNW